MQKKLEKKLVVIIFVFVLIITSCIYVTFSLLTAKTETVQNTFTIGKGVKIALAEPLFNVAANKHDSFAPGDIIDKDPTISIPEGGMDEEYACVNVKYYVDFDGDGIEKDTEQVTYNEFKNYAEFASDVFGTLTKGATHSGWITVDNNQTFYYGTLKAATTDEIDQLTAIEKGTDYQLFDKIWINSDIPCYDHDTVNYKKGQPIAFQIDIKAYAVQKDISSSMESVIAVFKDTWNLSIGNTVITP